MNCHIHRRQGFGGQEGTQRAQKSKNRGFINREPSAVAKASAVVKTMADKRQIREIVSSDRQG